MKRGKAARVEVSGLESHAGFWLRFVSNHVSQAFARRVAAKGVTVAEWVVLREIYGREGATPGGVAKRTGMTRGAISKLVDRLVRKELVTRRERDDDRRFQDIALTTAGERLVPELAALADKNDEEFFAPLAASERRQLIAAMKKLVSANRFQRLPTE